MTSEAGRAQPPAGVSGGHTFILGGNFSISQHTSHHFYDNAQLLDEGSETQGLGEGSKVRGIPEWRQANHSLSGQGTTSPSRHIFSNENIAFNAMHSSAQRYPPPTCLPGTRDAVLSLLKEAITDPKPSKSILWLYGTAGVGKSAVMQTLCDTFLKEGGHVSAAFFFGRGQGQRERGELLASTISFQLAQNLPGYKKSLGKVLSKKPHLHTQSPKEQTTALLVDAINGIRRTSWWKRPVNSSPITVIVDGLDECKGEEAQAAIVRTLHEASEGTNNKLRFLLASRPESHILVAFNSQPVAHATIRVPLDDSFKPAEAIRFYLVTKFQEIAAAHQGKLPNTEWPGAGTIEILVQAACGQFIFAHLVIAFVSMPRRDPEQQLQIVLDASQNAVAFSPLHSLYTQTLDNIEQRLVLNRVLGSVVVLKEPLPITSIADLMSVDTSTATLVLDQLRAVLKSDPTDAGGLFLNPVQFAHASFRDYLTDPARSGSYAVDQPAMHALIVRRYHELCIQRHLQSLPILPWPNPFRHLSIPTSHYLSDETACFHLKGCGRASESPILGALRLYLQQGLTHIVNSTPSLLSAPTEWWPLEGVIDIFVEPASYDGRFGVLDLVSALIRDRLSRQDPRAQFIAFLDTSRYHERWIPVDVLYTDFLENIPPIHRPTLKLVLGCITVARRLLDTASIADLMSLFEADVGLIVELLGPVLRPTVDGPSVHPSFRNYLLDRTRSGPYAVDRQVFHSLIIQRYHRYLIYRHLTMVWASSNGASCEPNAKDALSASASAYLEPEAVGFHIKASKAVVQNPVAGAVHTYMRNLLEGKILHGKRQYWSDLLDCFIAVAERNGVLELRFADSFFNFIQHRVSKCNNPQEQEVTISTIQRNLLRSYPFGPIYSDILSHPSRQHPCLRPSTLRRMLACVVLRETPPLTQSSVADLVGSTADLPPNDFRSVTSSFPFFSSTPGDPRSKPIYSPLKPFADFLADKSRAGPRAVDLAGAHRTLFVKWLGIWFLPSDADILGDGAQAYLDAQFSFHGGMYGTSDLCHDLGRFVPEDFDPRAFMARQGDRVRAIWCRRVVPGMRTLLDAHTRRHGSMCPYFGLLAKMCTLDTDVEGCRA